MFGMGFFEIVVIAVVAIIFLGPDKLPQAIIDVVKFLKVARKTIHDAKQTLDNELHISALQKEASSYHEHFNAQVESITKDMQLKEIDELFSEYKTLPASINPQNPTTIDSGELATASIATVSTITQQSAPESTTKNNTQSSKSSRAKSTKAIAKSSKSAQSISSQESKVESKVESKAESKIATKSTPQASSKALSKALAAPTPQAAVSPASSPTAPKSRAPKSRAKSRT